MTLSIVVEGETDIPVCQRLAAEAGFDDLRIMAQGNKQELDKRLPGFNAAARHVPWFVLRDLDRDAICPVIWLKRRRFEPSRWMSFRLAVRQIESWLLADRLLADFLRIPANKVPSDPDALDDAKQALVNLGRKSRSRKIREGLVPAAHATAKVGPLYSALVTEFSLSYWDPARAASRSDSLSRTRAALRVLADRWHGAGRPK